MHDTSRRCFIIVSFWPHFSSFELGSLRWTLSFDKSSFPSRLYATQESVCEELLVLLAADWRCSALEASQNTKRLERKRDFQSSNKLDCFFHNHI